MVANVKPQYNPVETDDPVKQILARFRHAQEIKDQWMAIFEECYEYALPQRESFYDESIGRRRTDRIFDETAVVGVCIKITSRACAKLCKMGRVYGRNRNTKRPAERS